MGLCSRCDVGRRDACQFPGWRQSGLPLAPLPGLPPVLAPLSCPYLRGPSSLALTHPPPSPTQTPAACPPDIWQARTPPAYGRHRHNLQAVGCSRFCLWKDPSATLTCWISTWFGTTHAFMALPTTGCTTAVPVVSPVRMARCRAAGLAQFPRAVWPTWG